MGSWEYNLVTNTLKGSKNYYRMLGYKSDQRTTNLLEYFTSHVHADDQKVGEVFTSP